MNRNRSTSPRRVPAVRTAALLAAFLLMAQIASIAPARAEIVEEAAAFVNGQIVTKSELEERISQVRSQLSQQFSGADLETRVDEVKKTVLGDMIRELILLQRAEIMGLDLEKIYKQAVDNLKQQQQIKTNDEFKALLQQEGISEKELRKILLRYNVPDIMINLEVRQKIVVTPEEIEDYYNSHPDEFTIEETYKFREVVILAENHEPGEMDKIASKMEADLAGGLPFSEAVLKYSDAPSRFQEGIVGPLKSADLAPEILHVLENLKEGEHSGAIRMRHGIHYVELETHTTPGKKTLDDVRAGIETKLMRERFPAELQAYYKRLYQENRIEVKPIYRMYAEGIPRS